MDTIENVCKELEKVVADINSKTAGNIDDALIPNIEKLSAAAETLGMKSGKKLIDNLSTVLKSFKDGKSAEESVAVRITALDFYIKNVLSSQGSVEDI
jgi:molecular chaperone GrpE (heat shock protein)